MHLKIIVWIELLRCLLLSEKISWGSSVALIYCWVSSTFYCFQASNFFFHSPKKIKIAHSPPPWLLGLTHLSENRQRLRADPISPSVFVTREHPAYGSCCGVVRDEAPEGSRAGLGAKGKRWLGFIQVWARMGWRVWSLENLRTIMKPNEVSLLFIFH